MWTQTVEGMGIKVSMDGKGRAIDNRWIERFWKTLKYKHIYLHPPVNGLELYQNIRDYMNYYNQEKVHHTTKEVPHERYNASRVVNQLIHEQLLTQISAVLV